MSGLDSVAALGLACNILQLVEVGRQTYDCIKTVYQGGKPDKDLGKNAATLKSVTDEIKKHSRPENDLDEFEKLLIESATRCSTAAHELGEEVRFLGEAKQGSFAAALKVAGKAFFRKGRLERCKKTLDEAENRLRTDLLAEIW